MHFFSTILYIKNIFWISFKDVISLACVFSIFDVELEFQAVWFERWSNVYPEEEKLRCSKGGERGGCEEPGPTDQARRVEGATGRGRGCGREEKERWSEAEWERGSGEREKDEEESAEWKEKKPMSWSVRWRSFLWRVKRRGGACWWGPAESEFGERVIGEWWLLEKEVRFTQKGI